MKFNYGHEKKKFNAHWEKLAAEYSAAGMSQEAIDKMKKFDWDSFKRDRIYSQHNQSLNSFDNDDASCPIIQRYLENFTCPARDTDPNRRDGWMDEIDSCQLSSFLKKLNQSDIELITLYAFDGYTVTEIAQLLSVTQPTISKKITRIQKNLKKIFGEAMD